MIKKLKSLIKKKQEANEMKKETSIWDELGVSKKEFDKYRKIFRHAEIDYESWSDLIKHLFPDSKENRVKAWSLVLSGIEAGESISENKD